MSDKADYTQLAAHLEDLRNRSEKWHRSVSSFFLTEEEQAAMMKIFPPSDYVRYDGGYEGARRKKVIFLYDEEDDFSDIACISSAADQRFRKIGHRDILGAAMALQIERHSLGDMFIQDDHIYIYTGETMARFLCDNLLSVGQLSVSFEITDERPVQQFKTKRITVVAASERADAVVAALAHCSRSQAKEMIRQGLVQLNHVTLEEPDELCNNNVTISIRGIGRFTYAGASRQTRSGRIAAEFLQDM
ncbi:MAG: RNA-binding protein [Solobacterium sp.]|nr:RNA-binding protein [Solobacterium sp.]MBQ9824404.1 RNA-binding protein [Solobacterium sp.]